VVKVIGQEAASHRTQIVRTFTAQKRFV